MTRIGISTFFALLMCIVTLTSCSKKDEPGAASGDSTATDTAPNAMMAMTPPTEGNLTPQERNFVSTALTGSKIEREIAQVALAKASASEVRSFAQTLVNDHSKAYDELLQMSIRRGLTLDTIVSAMQAQSKALLSQLSGKEFDREFISVMMRDHQKAHEDFTLIATTATDSTLKGYAQKHLEAIARHLEQAQRLNSGK